MANFLDRKEGAASYSNMAAFRGQPLGLGQGEELEQIPGSAVTSDFFAVLGVRPVVGRSFSKEEGIPGRDRVVILFHGSWQGGFGRRVQAVAEGPEMNGETCDITRPCALRGSVRRKPCARIERGARGF